MDAAIDECPFDRVTILDGSESTAPTLVTLCGKELPEDVISSQDSLLVLFSSDASRTSSGFWVSYTTRPEGKVDICVQANRCVWAMHLKEIKKLTITIKNIIVVFSDLVLKVGHSG